MELINLIGIVKYEIIGPLQNLMKISKFIRIGVNICTIIGIIICSAGTYGVVVGSKYWIKLTQIALTMTIIGIATLATIDLCKSFITNKLIDSVAGHLENFMDNYEQIEQSITANADQMRYPTRTTECRLKVRKKKIERILTRINNKQILGKYWKTKVIIFTCLILANFFCSNSISAEDFQRLLSALQKCPDMGVLLIGMTSNGNVWSAMALAAQFIDIILRCIEIINDESANVQSALKEISAIHQQIKSSIENREDAIRIVFEDYPFDEDVYGLYYLTATQQVYI